MNESDKLHRFVRDEIIKDIKIDPDQIVKEMVGETCDHGMICELSQKVKASKNSMIRASSFIFGDTYDLQPVQETILVLQNCGFEISESSVTDSDIELYHETYDLKAVIIISDGLMVKIFLYGSIPVGEVDLDDLFLFGLLNASWSDKILSIEADLTLAFSAKFHFIRSLATDGSDCLV